jgi:hypothetical protein
LANPTHVISIKQRILQASGELNGDRQPPIVDRRSSQDIDRYFDIWSTWSGLDIGTAALLTKKYGRAKFRRLVEANGIWIEGEGFPHTNMDDEIPF